MDTLDYCNMLRHAMLSGYSSKIETRMTTEDIDYIEEQHRLEKIDYIYCRSLTSFVHEVIVKIGDLFKYYVINNDNGKYYVIENIMASCGKFQSIKFYLKDSSEFFYYVEVCDEYITIVNSYYSLIFIEKETMFYDILLTKYNLKILENDI